MNDRPPSSESGADGSGADPSGELVPWSAFMAEARSRLAASGHEQADLEARWIVEEAAGFEPGEWATRGHEPATVRGVADYDSMMNRRLDGEPIQYVLGHWPFRMLDLMVDRRVLIPRPETEVLAGLVVDTIEHHPNPVVVDLGTGSGAIGLAVASEHRTAEVWLTDRSDEAVAVARANLSGIGPAAPRVRVVQGDWFDALDQSLRGSFDVVVSNPPYIAATERLDRSVVAYEPSGALIAGVRGAEQLEVLVAGAREWLADGGSLMLEMAPDQTSSIRELATLFGYRDVRIVRDLAGRDRIVAARWG